MQPLCSPARAHIRCSGSGARPGVGSTRRTARHSRSPRSRCTPLGPRALREEGTPRGAPRGPRPQTPHPRAVLRATALGFVPSAPSDDHGARVGSSASRGAMRCVRPRAVPLRRPVAPRNPDPRPARGTPNPLHPSPLRDPPGRPQAEPRASAISPSAIFNFGAVPGATVLPCLSAGPGDWCLTRLELFGSSERRMAIRAYELWVTVVNLVLAPGRSEAWGADPHGRVR